MHHNRLIAIAATALLVGAAHAQVPFTITDGNATYTQSSAATTTSSTAGLSNMSTAGTDRLYQHWWYYRIGGDSREFAFNNAAANGFVASASGATATMNWANVDGRGVISATQQIQVASAGPSQGSATSTMTVTNLTASPITVDLFAYADYDVCAASGNTATIGATEHVITNSSCGIVCRFGAVNPTATQATAFATLRGLLLNATLENLTGVGSGTFGPGDYTGAFQWTLTVPANGSASATCYLAESLACVPRYETYGTEGTGISGAPLISRGGPFVQDPNGPVVFPVNLSNARPGSFGLHLVSLGRGNTVLGGIGINVNLLFMSTSLVVINGSGNGSINLTIPPSPNYCGVTLTHQYVVSDAAAANGFASWTKGLETVLGGL